MRAVLRSADAVVRPRGRVFHGWWIALAGSGVQMLLGALLMHSYGAYFVLLQRDFGWSKTLLSGAFALSRIESGLLGPLQGWLLDRFGPRLIMQCGVVLFALGFVLFSRVDSIVSFYATYLLLALGASLGGFVSIMVSLVHWFDRHRAKALAVSQIGFALGGLAVPLVVLALNGFGWRTTALLSGVAVLVVGLPLSLVVHHRPEERGETADGIPPAQALPGAPTPPPRELDFTAREAMRTPAFWLISAGHSSALLVVSAVMVHAVPHMSEGLGYTLRQAAGFVALMTAAQIVGQVCGGYLGDRFDKRWIVITCMVAHASGLLLLAYATHTAMVLAFAVLHGWGWGTRGPLMVALRADYFGPSSFGTIMGFSSLIVMLGMTTGPILAGYMADRLGSYDTGLAVLALAALAGSLFFLFALPPQRPVRHTGFAAPPRRVA